MRYQLALLVLFFDKVSSLIDLQELEGAKYGVEILNTPLAIRQVVENSVDVVSKYGQRYRCSWPAFEATRSKDKETSKNETEETSTSDVIKKLLTPMAGACLTTTKGWWTYRFCYGKDITQFHVEGHGVAGDIVYLGHYSSEEEWTEEKEKETKKKKFAPRFHSQVYLNGTKCDITGKPRRAQVKFLCENGVGDYVARIDEPVTCQYIVYVHTTRICHHPFFRRGQPMKASPIKCYPLLEDNEYARYMKVLEEEEQVKRMEMEHQESEVLNKQTSLPFDSGFSDYDMDSEPFYEPGDEDAAARKHEADYDRRHKYSSTPLTETMKTNWLKKILSLKNGEEDTSEHESISNNDDGDSGGGDGDEDDDDDEDGGDGSLKMNKVVKKVMNLLSELKDNDKKEIADEEKMENRQGDKGKKKTNSGYDSNKVPGDSNNWKVRVRKMAQEETDHEMVEDEEEEKHLEITEALNKMKKKLENMIMQKLKEAGVRTEGEVKVKFVTATDAYSLSGDDGLHHLSDEETEELQELFGNNAGAKREQERHSNLESNYGRVWSHVQDTNDKEMQTERSETEQRDE